MATFSYVVSNDTGPSATVSINVHDNALVGQWDFNDPNALAKATIGNNLVAIGDNITSADGHDQPDASLRYLRYINTPDLAETSKSGAVEVGIDSHFLLDHQIPR